MNPYARSEGASMHPRRRCAVCQTVYRGSRHKYCSEACAFVGAYGKPRTAGIGEPRTCQGCAAEIVPHERERNVRKWCSESCRLKAYHARPGVRERQREAYRARAAERPRRVLPVRMCDECGTPYAQRRDDHRFCSEACRRRLASHRRRVAEGGGCVDPVTRSEILRASPDCALCGERLDASVPWPDPRAVTLDHIIPVSLGGDHSRENLQAAHNDCNARKGNR